MCSNVQYSMCMVQGTGDGLGTGDKGGGQETRGGGQETRGGGTGYRGAWGTGDKG